MQLSFYYFILAFTVRVIFILFQGVELEGNLVEDELLYWQNSLFFLEKGYIEESILYERMSSIFWYFKLLLSISHEEIQILLIIQAFIDSLSCLVIYSICNILFPHLRSYVFLSAIFSPLMIILSAQILSETIFLFFFVLFILFLVRSFYTKSSKNLYLFLIISGLFLGLASSIRSISFPLIFLANLPMALILIKRTKTKLEVFVSLILFTLFALIPISQRLVNNKINHNTLTLTSQAGTHLAYWVTPLVLSEKKNIDRASALEIVLEEKKKYNFNNNPYINDKILKKISFGLLLEAGIYSSLKVWGKGIIINIASPSFLLDKKLRNLPHPSFYETSNIFLWLKRLYLDSNFHKYLFLLVLSSVTSVFTIFSFFLGNILLYKESKAVFYICLLYIAYFLIITGPILSPKYIFPVLPCIFLYQGLTLFKAKQMFVSSYLKTKSL